MIRGHPRAAAALSFGVSTALATHFAWHADARMSGAIPFLTLGAGLAHAVGGAILGRRIVESRDATRAALLGAFASLIALALFAPAMAAYVESSNVRPNGALGDLALVGYTALFSFLAAGWALLLVSAGVGWGLNRLAETRHPPRGG